MDIQISESGLTFRNGNFVIDTSNRQEINLLLQENIGGFRKNPLLGVGMINFLNSNDLTDLKRIIYSNVGDAGNTLDSITIRDNKIDIDCEDY